MLLTFLYWMQRDNNNQNFRNSMLHKFAAQELEEYKTLDKLIKIIYNL